MDAVVEQCSPDALMGELTTSEPFALAVEYSHRVCSEYLGNEADQLHTLQFKLLEFFPVKYADRANAEVNDRPWGKVHEVVFPIVEGE